MPICLDETAFIENRNHLNSPKFRFKPKSTDCCSFKVEFLILNSKYGLKKEILRPQSHSGQKKTPKNSEDFKKTVNENMSMNILGKKNRKRKGD